MYSSLPYRPGVGVMLLNDAQQVFVARRIDTISEAWQMPQGGIDEGEDPYEAALRELAEETSVTSTKLLARTRNWLHYDLPETLIPQLWGGRYRGQKQHWFALKFCGTENEINLNTAHPEFCAWRWCGIDELPTLIVPFKRDLYRQIMAELVPQLG